jgi:[NiFe] hydrogenase assembly HybE family chaperone
MTATRECGVCWYTYDPSIGDEVWQIPAGTSFELLPAHWRCPRCDADRERFLPLREEPVVPGQQRALTEAYSNAAARMRGLPVFNPALRVEVTPPAAIAGGSLCVAITPWFMNLVFFATPAPAVRLVEGEKRLRRLPAGECEFVGARLEGVGSFEVCSLYSPMWEFRGPEAARKTADEALALLLKSPREDASGAPVPESSGTTRRELFTRFLPRR